MGPTARILLREKLSASQFDDLKKTLHLISNEVVKSEFGIWDFWCDNTQPIGGFYFGINRMFGVNLQTSEMEDNEAEIIAAAFGFKPQQILQWDAMCNDHEDHAILGTLVAHFAELYGGVIDFNGALLPNLPKEMYKGRWLWQEANWSDVAEYFNAMANEMTEKVVSIEYETIGGRTWAHHVADAQWMRAWLNHPNFHMIK